MTQIDLHPKGKGGADGLSANSDSPHAPSALVFHPYLKQRGGGAGARRRAPEQRLEEAAKLARAIGLSVVEQTTIPLSRVVAATYLGRGKVNEIGALVKVGEIDLVVADCALSPIQQRNLETAWGTKVIDRTGLILEIFGERAATREGVLQVELAHLEYQKSRLVRSWTHLERQRGGFGFLGGPGERQIEADRRALRVRIGRIRKELEKVVKTRQLHRAERQKVPYPVVALVGYTNAGKSTLFNRLTQANVMVKDVLFATLDPTMRSLKMPSGRKVILSDTVGFISDLPTELVAAFRATLEEVIEADLILHVRDAASADSEAQRADVMDILETLGVLDSGVVILQCLNKIDRMEEGERPAGNGAGGNGDIFAISALTGQGMDGLLDGIDRQLGTADRFVRISLPFAAGQALAWLHAHGEVRDQQQGREEVTVDVRLPATAVGRFEKLYPGIDVKTL
ncbi:MAG: GTPase HflX [Proteobacteria bacterium]|nr:GTPase HflX [Pseudomonadota bacterium]